MKRENWKNRHNTTISGKQGEAIEEGTLKKYSVFAWLNFNASGDVSSCSGLKILNIF